MGKYTGQIVFMFVLLVVFLAIGVYSRLVNRRDGLDNILESNSEQTISPEVTTPRILIRQGPPILTRPRNPNYTTPRPPMATTPSGPIVTRPGIPMVTRPGIPMVTKPRTYDYQGDTLFYGRPR